MSLSENSGFSPQIIPFFSGFPLFSPSILGIPLFFGTHPILEMGGCAKKHISESSWGIHHHFKDVFWQSALNPPYLGAHFCCAQVTLVAKRSRCLGHRSHTHPRSRRRPTPDPASNLPPCAGWRKRNPGEPNNDLDVSKNMGTPKWMVKIRENSIKMG